MAVFLTVFWIESTEGKLNLQHLGERKPYSIEVETYDVDVNKMSQKQETLSEESSTTVNDSHGSTSAGEETTTNNESLNVAQFSCGNPNVEKIEGIVHFYKENRPTPLSGDVTRPTQLCILNVPLRLTIPDFFSFIAPVTESISRIRVVKRSVAQNSYMALLNFRSKEDSDKFYQCYNGREYSSLEPETCSVVYVNNVELTKDDSVEPPSSSELTELPTCPVCLERMDESIEGVLTVLCNHEFHTACMQKCSDTTCPVCRCCLTPDFHLESTACSDCGATFEDLWICLICGNVGCGRYHGTHAYRHYEETHHLFSMHLTNGRVWDYASDNYVHRLIQSKGDGKLVEVPPANSSSGVASSTLDDEKVDAVTLEYTFLLTSQLESQRKYYEEKMMVLEQMCNEQLASLAQEFTDSKRKADELSFKIGEIKKEKEAIEQKYGNSSKQLAKLRADIDEERALNQSLRHNQEQWTKKVKLAEERLKEEKTAKEVAVKELQDQLRDLFFHLESQQRLESSGALTKDEQQNNQILITESPSTSGTSAKSGRRKKSGTSSSLGK